MAFEDNHGAEENSSIGVSRLINRTLLLWTSMPVRVGRAYLCTIGGKTEDWRLITNR